MSLTKQFSRKFITRIVCVLLGIFTFLPVFSSNTGYYAVQLAASKEPLDIVKFANRYQIKETIKEIVSKDWNRYIIGKFDNLRTASLYASAIESETGINGVFPRKVSNEPASPDEIKPDTVLKAQVFQNDTAKIIRNLPDSLSQEKKAKLVSLEQPRSSAPHRELNHLILRLIGDKNVNQTKNELLDYGKNHFPPSIRKYYNNFIERTYSYPVVLIFILLIFVFIINVSLILLVIYNTNKFKNKKERYRAFYKNYYEEVLSLYLFDINDWNTTLTKLKRLKKPENRRILTSVLLIFKENLRGEMDAKITEIFVRLELNQDSLKLTKSLFYYKKTQGIRELTNLDPQSATNIINHFINDKNYQIRTEAQISYVRLHPENPFDFLKNLMSPFSKWTQLSAFHIFRLHQIPVPAFIDYMNSAQSNVRNFCLRMIIFFQQFEDATEIFKMVESNVESSRFLAIRAINDLRLYDGKSLLLNIYNSEPILNQIEIIKALRNIGDEEDLSFLESVILSGSVTLKIEACRSLYFMSNKGEEWLNQIRQKYDIDIDLYLAHIKDPRN
jgi:hypothetical protein